MVSSMQPRKKKVLGRRAAVAPRSRSERRNAVSRKPSSPSTQRGAKTRDRLKEAAARVLERIGYRAMRLTDIAAEADVNVSLFYHYFNSKADITYEILAELVDPLTLPDAEAPKPPPKDPFDTLVDANLSVTQHYASRPGLMRCLVHLDEEEPKFSALYRRINATWNQRVARDIAKRCPDAGVSERECLLIAYALGGMVDNFLFETYVDRNPLLLEALPQPEDSAVFLAILWYRALYLRNPPTEKMGRFKALAQLQLRRG
jgi:TetR/AcrR family transcriptional regulator, ethionamide resistance regulator